MARIVKLKGLGLEAPPAQRYLVHKDGHRAYIGERITSFRGEVFVLTGWPNNGHNRVWVKEPYSGSSSMGMEFFPSVFGLEWEASDLAED